MATRLAPKNIEYYGRKLDSVDRIVYNTIKIKNLLHVTSVTVVTTVTRYSNTTGCRLHKCRRLLSFYIMEWTYST